jgi:photosynthetic reaction center H subunit
MQTGAITPYIDVAQLTLYAFWLFFAGLIFYLRREDKREGYPLVSDRSQHIEVIGFPPMPPAKTFIPKYGEAVQTPRVEVTEEVRGVASAPWPGAPLVPLGNPMLDALGPAAYAQRADVPDPMFSDGSPKIVPLRASPAHSVATEDPHLIGWTVTGADGVVAGTVIDIWIDRAEMIVRYIEVGLTAPLPARAVLLPATFAVFSRRAKEVRVSAILGEQFADVPALKNAETVTLREEDRICAYFAGGFLYATPERAEPLI